MTLIKVVAMPRDPNPYQELLYAPLRRAGVIVRYAGQLTPSRSLNLLLLPLELACCRLRRYRVLHVHWTYCFRFTGAAGSPAIARASRGWFGLVLWVATKLGIRVAWTAHNVLPHDPVFDDDLAARRTLIAASDLVIAHSRSALQTLERVVGTPRRSRIIPLGPVTADGLLRLPPPQPSATRTVLFFGQIAAYKGVEDLLDASGAVRGKLRLIVAGRCSDPGLRDRLRALAAAAGSDVALSLGHVPDADLPALFNGADAVVYPFRAVTTSSSVILGLSSGRLGIVPDLPAFDDLGDEGVIRYPAGQAGLARSLMELAVMPIAELQAKGAAARTLATRGSWEDIAKQTIDAFQEITA